MCWTQVATTAIGAFLGFAFALALYWVKESLSAGRNKKNAIKNLRYELEYNLNLYGQFKRRITDTIESINSDERSVHLNLDYEFIGSYFARQFYNGGYLTEFLHQEDMKRWNVFLSRLSPGSEEYIEELVSKWRETKIEKNAVVNSLKNERSHVDYAIEMTQYLLDRIKL
jgi:hypothetical protein